MTRMKVVLGRKNCLRCTCWRPVSDFRPMLHRDDGREYLLSYCYPCHRALCREYARARYIPHPRERMPPERMSLSRAGVWAYLERLYVPGAHNEAPTLNGARVHAQDKRFLHRLRTGTHQWIRSVSIERIAVRYGIPWWELLEAGGDANADTV